jgi:hypothetical protein
MTASPVTESAPAVKQVGDNPGLHLVAALQDYSDVYLNCRGIQHRWSVSTDLHISETLNEGELVERHLLCENCATVRKDRFLLRADRWQVQRLEVLGAVYKYPEGYLMAEMIRADHPREILRSEMFKRATRPKRRRQG